MTKIELTLLIVFLKYILKPYPWYDFLVSAATEAARKAKHKTARPFILQNKKLIISFS
jgi:hypothetical protein